jgi:hypothetical protein
MADSSETRCRFLGQSFLTVSALTVCLVLWMAAMFVILTYYNWSTSPIVWSMPIQLSGLHALLSDNPVYKSFRFYLSITIFAYVTLVVIICWHVRSYLKCHARNNPGSSSVHMFVPTCRTPVIGQNSKLRKSALYFWVIWCGSLIYGSLLYNYRHEVTLWSLRRFFGSDFTDEAIIEWILNFDILEFDLAISYVSYNYFLTSSYIFLIWLIRLDYNKATYGLE